MPDREFTMTPAVRKSVPSFVGLCGASSSGKTFSALRLATGMQKITGGDIALIDTEGGRSLYYADDFKFLHVPFEAPFDSVSYLKAVLHCKNKGAKIVIVDSMTHEHTGAGGCLEQHDAELDRMVPDARDFKRREKMTFTAWVRPKKARQDMMDGFTHAGVNLILCFRAGPKLKIESGKDPVQLGFQPIGASALMYEMLVSFLLYPNEGGVPVFTPEHRGEQQLIKIPKQFTHLFANKKEPLAESIGEEIAKWAAGGESGAARATAAAQEAPPSPHSDAPSRLDDVLADIMAAADTGAVKMIADEQRPKDWTLEERDQIGKAINLRTRELKGEK